MCAFVRMTPFGLMMTPLPEMERILPCGDAVHRMFTNAPRRFFAPRASVENVAVGCVFDAAGSACFVVGRVVPGVFGFAVDFVFGEVVWMLSAGVAEDSVLAPPPTPPLRGGVGGG